MMRCSVCGSLAVSLDPARSGHTRCGFCEASDSGRLEPVAPSAPRPRATETPPNAAELIAYYGGIPDIEVDYG